MGQNIPKFYQVIIESISFYSTKSHYNYNHLFVSMSQYLERRYSHEIYFITFSVHIVSTQCTSTISPKEAHSLKIYAEYGQTYFWSYPKRDDTFKILVNKRDTILNGLFSLLIDFVVLVNKMNLFGCPQRNNKSETKTIRKTYYRLFM